MTSTGPSFRGALCQLPVCLIYRGFAWAQAFGTSPLCSPPEQTCTVSAHQSLSPGVYSPPHPVSSARNTRTLGWPFELHVKSCRTKLAEPWKEVGSIPNLVWSWARAMTCRIPSSDYPDKNDFDGRDSNALCRRPHGLQRRDLLTKLPCSVPGLQPRA